MSASGGWVSGWRRSAGPAYINVGRDGELPAGRTVEAMRAATWTVLDAAYAAGVRWVDAARSYGRSEEFLAGWLDDRGHARRHGSSKWGYAYVGGWRAGRGRARGQGALASALPRPARRDARRCWAPGSTSTRCTR